MNDADKPSILKIGLMFLALGCTSFGGPAAHIGFFHETFVSRRRWLSEREFANLVALCQFLPGPASSQLGMAIGHKMAGQRGLFAAWLGFTLPSAVIMIALAIGLNTVDSGITGGILHGLKLAATAVVAIALYGMATTFCRNRKTIAIALISTSLMLLLGGQAIQLLIIICAALGGAALLQSKPSRPQGLSSAGNKSHAKWFLLIFFALLVLPLILVQQGSAPLLTLAMDIYRTGALVFGGGHVVLPLLEELVIPTGLLSTEQFLAGYGAAQALPGPLFSFAAYLGGSVSLGVTPVIGGLLLLVMIFLPSWLLLSGVLPYWARLQQLQGLQSALVAVNAAVVGLLLSAWLHPMLALSVRSPGDVVLLVVACALLFKRVINPAVLVLLFCVLGYQFY